MIKAHKIKLYPTRTQEILLRKSCGVARYSYNWALAKWIELYKSGQKTSAYTLIKLQNSIKRDQMPFFLEVSKTAPQYAIHNLESSFKSFFKGVKKYPKFKKKGKGDSFVAVENNLAFNQKNYKIHIPRIGKLKCAENLRFEGKVNNVVVKRIANMWFAVINIEIPNSIPALKVNTGDNQAIVGIDLGIKTMMVLSDGTAFDNPKALRSNIKRLKRLQRRLSNKRKGSKNSNKSRMRLARLHYRVRNIRSSYLHQATSFIVKSYDRIVIENLNPSGMVKNRRLAQAVQDVSFSEIRRQLAYKCLWESKELVVADRWFASSKTCSGCGHKKTELKLSERTYNCDNCGLSIDRDLNAAKNLAAYRPTSKCEGSKACGEGSSVAEMQHSPSANQESNFINQIKF